MTRQGSSKKKSSKLVGLFIAAAVIIPIGLGFGPDFCREMERQRIVEEGIFADAVIIDINDTGNRMNDNPEVEISLQVTAKDGSSYRAVYVDYLSPVTLVKVSPGKTVKVKYDPEDPSRVVVAGL